MLLMIDKHFLQAPFTWQQRAAFWAAFLYYMSSAALLITGPFPTLTMIWFFPAHIEPQNYLPILPALAAAHLRGTLPPTKFRPAALCRGD